MSHGPFTCSTHTAFIYERGGEEIVGELLGLESVMWRRIRDDISNATVRVRPNACCELLGDLQTILHELHIFSNDEVVWQGPITRLEYEYDQVTIYAEDMLWVPKRTALEVGYSYAHPNIANAVTHCGWLLWEQCFSKYGDPWNMLGHVQPVHGPDDPNTAREVAAWSLYVWDDLDKYAEDYGIDYTVVNRDIYVWDTQLAWVELDLIDHEHISQFPRIVEYGNSLATRVIVTDGKGHAGQAEALEPWRTDYRSVDMIINNQTENEDPDYVPSAQDIAQWSATAARNVDGRYPSPVGIVIPSGSTLMPGAPWTIDELIPGAWFPVQSTSLCRELTEWQRLHEVVVTEDASSGDKVAITSISPPKTRVEPL